ncbi:Gp37-like protein, partial [Bacillus safensis]|uniref:Gp37-like protein n=1 Tax=Bacillus safensis TaxID=561879 RepID=UPI00366242ED
WRLGLPITFMPYTLLRDTTPVRVGMARMVPLDELFEQWLKDSGCHLTITLWLPGDEQPHPDLFLTRPQYIVDVVQQPRTGGLLQTGSVLDGIADTIGNLIAAGVNLLTGWLNPGIGQAVSDALTSKEVPSVVFRSDGSAIDDATVTVTHPLYYSSVIGGKSPTWVNKLIDLGVQMAITWIFSLIGLAVIPGLAGFISGIFHDVFLAFQKFVDWALKADLGPLGFPEGFVNAGAAYTFSGFQAGTKGLWDGRGTRSASITLRDGAPYTAFVDYDLGQLAGWEDEDDGQIYYDRITAIAVEDTREGGIVLKTVIGDDKPDEAPWEVGMRQIKELFGITNFLAVN